MSVFHNSKLYTIFSRALKRDRDNKEINDKNQILKIQRYSLKKHFIFKRLITLRRDSIKSNFKGSAY